MAHEGQVVQHKCFCSRILFLSSVPLVPGGEVGLRASLWAMKTNSTATWQTAGMSFLRAKGFQTRRGALWSLSKIDTGDTELLMPNLTWLQEEGVRFHEVTKSVGKAFWRHFDCSPPFQEWSTWEHIWIWRIWSWWKAQWQGAQTVLVGSCLYPPVLTLPKERLALQKGSLSLSGNLSVDSTLQKLGHLFTCLSTQVTGCRVKPANRAQEMVILGLQQVLLLQLWPCTVAGDAVLG